jgi:hypothetical protein
VVSKALPFHESYKSHRARGLSEADATTAALRGESMSDRESRIRRAIQDHVSPPKKDKVKSSGSCCEPSYDHCWVKEIFDKQGFAIVEKGKDLLRVPFTLAGSKVTCGTPTKVREVKTYEPA